MSEVMEEAIMDEPITDVGSDAGAVEPVEASGVVDAGTQELAPEAATPAWAPSQEAFESLQQQQQRILEMLQPPAPPEPQAPEWLQSDPETGEYGIDPNALREYIQYEINQGVQQRIGAFEPVLNQTVADRGEQVISQHLETLKGKVGDFDPAIAREIAEGLAARPGADPYRALEEGAKRANAYLNSIKQAAVEEYKQSLSNIGNARTDGAVGGSAVSSYEIPRNSDGKLDYGAAVDNYLARRGLS